MEAVFVIFYDPGATELPFGFGMSISEIQNEFTIVKNGSNVAGLNTVKFLFITSAVQLLMTLYAQPLGASTSSIAVLSPTDTEGTINITIVDSVLNATDPEHKSFSAFSTCAFVVSNGATCNCTCCRHGTHGFYHD